jgi:hypothetical protein
MSDPRDDLAALIWRAGQDARDAYHAAGYRCGFDPDRFIADAILAAGWRPPGTTFDVCGHGRRRDESCILCERVIP